MPICPEHGYYESKTSGGCPQSTHKYLYVSVVTGTSTSPAQKPMCAPCFNLLARCHFTLELSDSKKCAQAVELVRELADAFVCTHVKYAPYPSKCPCANGSPPCRSQCTCANSVMSGICNAEGCDQFFGSRNV